MRDTFELWLIVEAEFNAKFAELPIYGRGLCNIINILFETDKINLVECSALKNTINDYKAARGRALEAFAWERGAVKPRRLFIHKQLMKAIRQ